MARQEKELNNRMDLQILDMKGLLAMKPNWIVFSIVLCMIIGCTENPIETNINEKYGYSLSAYFDGNLSDSSLYIKIYFNGIQHDLPKISIDNQQIDTGYYPDYFFHEITNFRRNSFKYTIEIDNDRIEDSIIIPSRIDSIYCNSKLLKDTMNLVLDSSSFVFSWKKS